MMMTHTYARTDVLGMHLHRVVSSFPRRPSCVRFPILALIDLPRLGNSYGTVCGSALVASAKLPIVS